MSFMPLPTRTQLIGWVVLLAVMVAWILYRWS